jgi:DNA replication protein DnaC
MRNTAADLLATAKAQRWDPAEAVRALLTEELTGRQASSIGSRRKAAGFPTGKTFDGWDETISSIPQPTQRALCTLEWVNRAENVVVCGPSGSGKTHFLEALGHQAIHAGHHVSWFSLETLGAILRRHRAEDTTGRAIKRIMRADVIVIDDIGLLPVAAEAAEALYRVVDAAYEKRSIALSGNLHPAGLDELMPKTITNATVDRAHAPRPRHAHRRRLDPAHPSHRRQGGDAIGPLTQGRTPGHHRAVLQATSGHLHWPTPGRSHRPLRSKLPEPAEDGAGGAARRPGA